MVTCEAYIVLILRTYAHIAPLYPFPSLVPIYLLDLPPYDTFAQQP